MSGDLRIKDTTEAIERYRASRSTVLSLFVPLLSLGALYYYKSRSYAVAGIPTFILNNKLASFGALVGGSLLASLLQPAAAKQAIRDYRNARRHRL